MDYISGAAANPSLPLNLENACRYHDALSILGIVVGCQRHSKGLSVCMRLIRAVAAAIPNP